MSLLLIEGFDHVQNLGLKNWVNVASYGPGAGSSAGLGGPRVLLGHSYRVHLHASLGIGAGQATFEQRKIFPATSTQVILGFGWLTDSYTEGDKARVCLTNSSGGTLAYLRLNGTRNIEIVTAAGVVGTSTSLMQDGVWHYIEWRLKINGASGETELRVDGGPDVATVVSNNGTTPIGGVSVYVHVNGGYDETVEYWVDDMYALDMNTGSAPHNDFLNDCRVETLFPTGPGASTDWTPLAGSNWSNVDEMTGTFPDDDTTYVTAQNAGDRDLYVCSDMSVANALVYGVQANLTARKDTAGFKQIKPVTRQGGSNYSGASMTLSTSYLTKQQIFERDPTGALWVPATVNADQYGMEVIV